MLIHYFGSNPGDVPTEQLYRSVHTFLCLCPVNRFYGGLVCVSSPSVKVCMGL